ncbi:alpha/beta hydrolase [Microbacterium sp. NIBRBAC000506063]|uniref:alpha/beta hydrolase n=1 Tax=Microbacterium sp. NIBRBAC000506063 TaxID=2734618 RepID=UPI002948BC60|nr:alpha/beta hydrolase fold domain-containing protein [Microbacterium sp. NIBRBAC000506063]
MTSIHPSPPFDPELNAALDLIAEMIPPTVTPEMIPALRQMPEDPTFAEQVAAVGAVHEERTIAGFDGGEIVASIFRRPDQTTPGPGIYHIHGGGMILGNRLQGVQGFLPYIASHGAVIVSVEYRLAPEFPDPVPVEDCYAGLVWTAEHADELGIDLSRLIVGGASAGADCPPASRFSLGTARDRRCAPRCSSIR